MIFYLLYVNRNGQLKTDDRDYTIYQAKEKLAIYAEAKVNAYLCPKTKLNLQNSWMYTENGKIYFQADIIPELKKLMPLTKEAMNDTIQNLIDHSFSNLHRRITALGYDGPDSMLAVFQWVNELPSIFDFD